MAKKKKAAKTNPNQVVVKVTGGALPSSLCFVAGEILARASEVVRLASAFNSRKGGAEDTKAALRYAAQELYVLQKNFPLTSGKIAPIERRFEELAKSKLKGKEDAAVSSALNDAVREIEILRKKARVGCNVNRV